jgi:phosphoribosylamine--glycine ligase
LRVLVLGGGGREHALCWRIARSPSVERVFCAPGNPGIAQVAETAAIHATDSPELIKLCRDELINLVVIGPERPAIAGAGDKLRDAGFAVYGPSAACAKIEGSKAFAKDLMASEGIPTAAFRAFTHFDSARAYIESKYAHGREVVVKASGEALGKGVVVADSQEHAVETARLMLDEGAFGEAGRTVVVEQKLMGPELSLMAVCSGERYALLPPARDYKSAYDGGSGPNTGGMGAVSPIESPNLAQLAKTFIEPVLRRFATDGTPYVGTLYAGLMLTPEGPMALEYNARFGDPETEAVLPRVEGDFAQALFSAATGQDFGEFQTTDNGCVTVMLCSKGYPGKYEKAIPLPVIFGNDLLVFHAGTALSNGALVSAGGRVLAVTSLASTVAEARSRIYASLESVQEEHWHFRRDIGLMVPSLS